MPAFFARPLTLRFLYGASLCSLALWGSALAQTPAQILAQPAQPAQPTYPTKPITLVVAYPPGGSTDLIGRTLGQALSKRLGVPVLIENLGGAGGAIGAQKVANASADGYTLLVGASNELVINRMVNPAVKYRLQDFTAIGLIVSQPLVLVASIRSGVSDIDGFIQRVRAKPGKYSYGSSGVGTSLHLAGEMLKQQAALELTHVPYRGVAPLANDLLGGTIDFGVFALSSGMPHIQAGKVLALGTTEAKRAAATPDIPALGEHSALRGLEISSWTALVGPAHLPVAVQTRLQQALGEVVQSADFRKKMEATGATVQTIDVPIQQFLTDESNKHQKIVNQAKITE